MGRAGAKVALGPEAQGAAGSSWRTTRRKCESRQRGRQIILLDQTGEAFKLFLLWLRERRGPHKRGEDAGVLPLGTNDQMLPHLQGGRDQPTAVFISPWVSGGKRRGSPGSRPGKQPEALLQAPRTPGWSSRPGPPSPAAGAFTFGFFLSGRETHDGERLALSSAARAGHSP